MPGLDTYKKILGTPRSNGEARKIQSDMIMESTWWEDIDARIGYFFDFYHDECPLQFRNIEKPYGVPIEIKYITNSSQTMDKDQVTFHVQFKPSYNYMNDDISYYKEMFEDRYGAIFPIGLYVLIPDNKGIFQKWLVVDKANYYTSQFSTFEILPCDYLIQYIIDNTKYQMCAVLRSQNSYNSGIWNDRIVTIVEDCDRFSLNHLLCWNTLRALMPKREDEICLYGMA